MYWTKIKLVALVLMLATLGGAGVGVYYLNAQGPVPKTEEPAKKPEAAAPANTPAKQGKERIKELLKLQRKQAERELKLRLESFKSARKEPGTTTSNFHTQMIAASKRLLTTEVELSENKADRLAAYERNLDLLKMVAAITEAQYKSSRVSAAALAQAQYELLGAEIGLEREKERK